MIYVSNSATIDTITPIFVHPLVLEGVSDVLSS